MAKEQKNKSEINEEIQLAWFFGKTRVAIQSFNSFINSVPIMATRRVKIVLVTKAEVPP